MKKTPIQKPRMKPDFKADITPLEAAYIARFYYMDSMRYLTKPQDFEYWNEIKRHWIVIGEFPNAKGK